MLVPRAWFESINFGHVVGVRNDFPLIQYKEGMAVWTTYKAMTQVFNIPAQSMRDFLQKYEGTPTSGIKLEQDRENLRLLKQAGVVPATANRVRLLQIGRAVSVARGLGLHDSVVNALLDLWKSKPKPPPKHIASMEAIANGSTNSSKRLPPPGVPPDQPRPEGEWGRRLSSPPDAQRRRLNDQPSAHSPARTLGEAWIAATQARTPVPNGHWPPAAWVFPSRLPTFVLRPEQAKVDMQPGR